MNPSIQTLADGVYSYIHTPAYGPSWPVVVTIQHAQVTAYQTGEGEGARVASPERLTQIGAQVLSTLNDEIKLRGRVPGLMVPVQFAPALIGKARAHKLHRILARLGYPSAQHYGLAAAALGEPFPLESLASLTETEARRVWAYLCSCAPVAARQAAS